MCAWEEEARGGGGGGRGRGRGGGGGSGGGGEEGGCLAAVVATFGHGLRAVGIACGVSDCVVFQGGVWADMVCGLRRTSVCWCR